MKLKTLLLPFPSFLIAAAMLAGIVMRAPGAARADGPLGFGPEYFTEELETDRPDFTEGTQTIDPGHIQVEGGYTFAYDDEDGIKLTAHTVPELLVRVGVLDDLELRLAWPGYVREELEDEQGEETTVQGAGDLSLGFKRDLYDQYLMFPRTSFIMAFGIPTGGSEVTADDTEAELKLLWSYELPKDLSLAGNINATSPVEDGERFFEASASITMAYPLIADLGGYLEYFGFYPNSDAPDDTSTHYLNTGFTYGLGDNVQLDLRVGAGLNDEAVDFFTGLGMAFRQ